MLNTPPPFIILTVTWSGDRSHFSLLRESIHLSRFASIPHHVIVQSEDLKLFREFSDVNRIFYSSADILPVDVEAMRNHARQLQQGLGRNITRVMSSISRYLHWPQWVRYTGWHTQQLCKLAFVAASQADTVVIMDSDLIVSPYANEQDFISPQKIIGYQDLRPVNSLKGKTRHWQETAHQLFGTAFPAGNQYDAYYDTPCVMHAPTVRAMLQWLEQRYQKPWWQILLQLPPRRWSEFGIYKHYLRNQQTAAVELRNVDVIGYLFDASNTQNLAEKFDGMLKQKRYHYITIHSQSSGRQLWTADAYRDLIRQKLLDASRVLHT